MPNDINLGNYTNLTIDVVTNLYLYGKTTTPEKYEDRLRTTEQYNNIPIVHIDMKSYMTAGPGRYAHASEANFVKNFFNKTLPFGLSDGSYTKAVLVAKYKDFYLMNGYNSKDAEDKANREFNIQVVNYTIDATSADYAARTYIFNNAGFTISSDAVFVISGGVRSVSNMAVHAFTDDFDFKTGSGTWAQFGNSLVLKDEIDPYTIGRKISIAYDNKQNVPVTSSYGLTQFNADHTAALKVPVNGSLYPNVLNAMLDVVSHVESVGTIEYKTVDGKIIYGSAGNNSLTGTSGKDIIVAGEGYDLLVGGAGNDKLYGGDNNDGLKGDAGIDELIGGKGNDSLTGGSENDRFIINNGDGADTIADREQNDRKKAANDNAVARKVA